jgi:hypothetical protein
MGVAARTGIILLVSACLGPGAWADALHDGTGAFAKKHYSDAMRLLAPLADAGDPVAGCMVTIMLDRARGRVA